MIRVTFALTGVLFLAAFSSMSAGAESEWGVWEEDDGNGVYEFLPNNEFRFSQRKKVWVKNANIIPISPRDGWTTGRYVTEREYSYGAWEVGKNICSSIDPTTKKKITGDLRIYVSSVECCIETRRLGSKLILRQIGVKGEAPEICTNRVLGRPHTPPDDT